MQALARFPTLCSHRHDGTSLKGAIVYHDGQVGGALARTTRLRGLACVPGARVRLACVGSCRALHARRSPPPLPPHTHTRACIVCHLQFNDSRLAILLAVTAATAGAAVANHAEAVRMLKASG